MNKFLVYHRSPHHATNSGYGRLIDFMDAEVVYGKTKFPFTIAKFFSRFHSQTLGNYNAGSVLKAIELYALLKKNKRQNNIVHFLNGERDIRHLGFLKKRFPHTKFCATFHKPPEVLLRTIPNPAALRKLDGAIAVGANQVDFLKEWLGLDQVLYIPHGVDTEFFKPNPILKKKNTLLFVGQHLRDFDTFNNAIPKIAANVPNLNVDVVIHPAYISRIRPQSYVQIYTYLNDEALCRFYQEATVLFLPLLNSTACNSILEAMACGLPIITNDVGGTKGYLHFTKNTLVLDSEIEIFPQKVMAVLNNVREQDRMAQLNRQHAELIKWSDITELLIAFYASLINEPPYE